MREFGQKFDAACKRRNADPPRFQEKVKRPTEVAVVVYHVNYPNFCLARLRMGMLHWLPR